ncbi:MAG: hypothetical protein ABI625_12765 [bacterium]
MSSPIREKLRVAAFVALFAFVTGVALPGGVAFSRGVFFRDSMESHLPPDTRSVLRAFRSDSAVARDALLRIDQRLTATGGNGLAAAEINDLLALRQVYLLRANRRAPVSVQPFFQHILMYFWPAMYFCLGLLLTVLRPRYVKTPNWRVAAGWSLVIFIASVLPLALRNIALQSTLRGRIVFAYSNLDVDRVSFGVQVFNFAVFASLLSLIWLNWIDSLPIEAKRRSAYPSGAVDAVLAPERIAELSDLAIRWQLAFAVLSVGFVVYTAVFWRQIILAADLRFVPEAIVVHGLWFISAVLMALPFWSSWRAWQFDRIRALAELSNRSRNGDATTALDLAIIQEVRPFGSWNAAAFGLTLASSALVPLIQLLLR